MNTAKLKTLIAVIILIGCSLGVQAQPGLQPYVLAWQGQSDLQTVLDNVRKSLRAVGFEMVGGYRVFEGAHVLVVSAPLLRKLAAAEPNAAYLLGQRVAVVRMGDRVQVSYANPLYYARAYRVNGDILPLVDALHASLGDVRAFGSDDGVPADRLAHYQYSYGMEYFEDQLELGDFRTQRQAVESLEQGFRDHPELLQRVYRVDVPAAQLSVFGVGIRSGAGADAQVHQVLDHRDLRHVAQLPYEVVVHQGRVRALHPRFRLALNFPDVKMVGRHSFMQLRNAPDEIHVVLRLIAGANREN